MRPHRARITYTLLETLALLKFNGQIHQLNTNRYLELGLLILRTIL